MNIEKEGDKIYFSRQQVAQDLSIKTEIFNLPNFEYNESEKSFQISSHGVYWLIPFSNDPPVELQFNALCIYCYCSSSGGSECDIGTSSGFYCSSSCCCTMHVFDCSDMARVTAGGGVLVEASECIAR